MASSLWTAGGGHPPHHGSLKGSCHCEAPAAAPRHTEPPSHWVQGVTQTGSDKGSGSDQQFWKQRWYHTSAGAHACPEGRVTPTPGSPRPWPCRMSYPSCLSPGTEDSGSALGLGPGAPQHGEQCQVPGAGPAAPASPGGHRSQRDVTCEGAAGIGQVRPLGSSLPKPERAALGPPRGLSGSFSTNRLPDALRQRERREPGSALQTAPGGTKCTVPRGLSSVLRAPVPPLRGKGVRPGPSDTGGSAHLPGLSTPAAPSVFPGGVGGWGGLPRSGLRSFSGWRQKGPGEPRSSLSRRKCQRCCPRQHHRNERTRKKGQCPEAGRDLRPAGPCDRGVALTQGWVSVPLRLKPFRIPFVILHPHDNLLQRVGFPFHRWENGGPEPLIAFPGSWASRTRLSPRVMFSMLYWITSPRFTFLCSFWPLDYDKVSLVSSSREFWSRLSDNLTGSEFKVLTLGQFFTCRPWGRGPKCHPSAQRKI